MNDLPGRCKSCGDSVVLIGTRWCDARSRRPHKCKASTARLAAFGFLATAVWLLLAIHW